MGLIHSKKGTSKAKWRDSRYTADSSVSLNATDVSTDLSSEYTSGASEAAFILPPPPPHNRKSISARPASLVSRWRRRMKLISRCSGLRSAYDSAPTDRRPDPGDGVPADRRNYDDVTLGHVYEEIIEHTGSGAYDDTRRGQRQRHSSARIVRERDQCFRAIDDEYFDEHFLVELVKLNMKANNVYAPSTCRNHRVCHVQHRLVIESPTTATRCCSHHLPRLAADDRSPRHRSSSRRNHQPVVVVADLKTLDDSGIADIVDAPAGLPGTAAAADPETTCGPSTAAASLHRHQHHHHHRCRLRQLHRQRQQRPTAATCPTSTHHWYRHRHREQNERRAMRRVAEWIDHIDAGAAAAGLTEVDELTTDEGRGTERRGQDAAVDGVERRCRYPR